MLDSIVMVRIPAIDGNQAVTAVATPRRISDTIPSTCSRTKMMIAITPMARKPGISRTVCSQPLSDPSKWPTSMMKLFRSADHVAKAIGIAAAITKRRLTGRRQSGRCRASANGIAFCMPRHTSFRRNCPVGLTWIKETYYNRCIRPPETGPHPTEL